jgi:hypothetical protein
MSEYLHRMMCGDNTVTCDYCKIDEDCWVFPSNWWRCCINYNLHDGEHETAYHTMFCSYQCKNAYMRVHGNKYKRPLIDNIVGDS